MAHSWGLPMIGWQLDKCKIGRIKGFMFEYDLLEVNWYKMSAVSFFYWQLQCFFKHVEKFNEIPQEMLD